MAIKFEYTVLDLLDSAVRVLKTAPLNLGGVSGSEGGTGTPPGGFVGQLPQRRVTYDTTEAATLFTPSSGMSLLDNLNHIRYRLNQLELYPSGLVVEDYDGNPSVDNVNRIVFSGAILTDQGNGRVLVVVSGGAGGSALTVEELDGSPSINNVDKIIFSGAVLTDLGSGDVLVQTGAGSSFIGDTYSVVLTDDTTGALTTMDWLKWGIAGADHEYLDFSTDIPGQETNAGKMGYHIFGSGYFYIVGAGESAGSRWVLIYDNLKVGTAIQFSSTNATVLGTDSNGTIIDNTGAIPYTDLTGRPSAENNANDIFRNQTGGASTSTFSGTINGTPSGASVVYNAGFSGNENALVPFSTSQLGKLRLYNTTRGNSALILDCNTGTNTITLTDTAPANWASGDTITIASQTVSGGTGNWVDIEITTGLVGRSYVFMNLQWTDSGTVTSSTVARVHPTETFGLGKIFAVAAQVSGFTNSAMVLVKLTSNVFTVSWISSGSGTGAFTIRELGYLE